MIRAIIFDCFGVLDDDSTNDKLFEFIAELKAEYKLGVLSNAGGDWLEQMFGKENAALFDSTALSYETKEVKPRPRAYEIIAERLGVDVTECVFIDDSEGYCSAARDCGMQAILYRGTDQCIAEIKQLLSASKD